MRNSSFVRNAYLFIMLAFLMLTACQPKALEWEGSSILSGKLLGFSYSSSMSMSSGTNTTLACAAPQVSIYKLADTGDRILPAVSTTSIGADGSYSFAIRDLNIKLISQVPSEPLIAIVSGCTSGVYQRPITGAKQQDVTMGSSVMSYMLNTNQKAKLAEHLKDSSGEVKELLALLSGSTSFADAYAQLTGSSAASAKFNQIFGVSASALDDAAPEIISKNLPSNAQELAASSFAVTATHWSPSYTMAYSWQINGVSIGQADTISYTPTANSQGNKLLTLFVGQSDGAGGIDLSKPYKTISQTITIANNILPTSPNFSVTSPAVVGTTPINTRNLTLSIATGASKTNCGSFSKMLLTENNAVTPEASDFGSLTCTTAGTQTLSYTLLSNNDGPKLMRLWTLDSAGVVSALPAEFTVYLDTGVPTATITTTPLALSNSTTQNFSFTGDDNGGVIDRFECKLDAASYSACSSPISLSSLTEGSHTFLVKAFDTAGNVSTAVSKIWSVDLTAPALTYSSTPTSITNQLVSSFAFSATDSGGGAVAGYECKINGGAWATCFSPHVETLTAGSHNFSVRAKDTAGNISAGTNYSWVIDTTIPTVTISAKPLALTNATTATFSFSGSDTGGGSIANYECKLDGGSFMTCVTGQNYSSLGAGSHTFEVKATDTAGNMSAAAAYTWTVDLTTPLASINANPPSITNQTSATFQFSANPPSGGSIAGYECSLNGGAYAGCVSPKTYTGLIQGTRTFDVKSIDNNGNHSTASSYSWIVDTTLPVLTVTDQPSTPTLQTNAGFTFSAVDSGGGSIESYECRLNSAAFASCSSPVNLNSLTQGSYTYDIKALDTAGNYSTVSTIAWVIDTTAPVVTIASKPNAITNAQLANFTFSATDTGGAGVSAYECSVDSQAYASCTSPQALSSLAAGAHSFAVRATDQVGNVSAAVTHNWTIDVTVPTLSITSKPSAITNQTTASFAFSGSDTGGGAVDHYECKLDSGSFATCTSPHALSGLSSTAHTFSVKVFDTAGNESAQATYAWSIDTTNPTISITTPASNGSFVAAASLSNFSIGGSCSEDTRTVQLAGASTAAVTCSGGSWSTNIDLTGLSDGTLSLTATHTDEAGNSVTTAARTFVKDATFPVINVTTPLATLGNGNNGTLSWSLTETNVPASSTFTIELFDGTSWISAGTKAATAGNNSNQAYSLSSISIPNINITTARFRVALTDAAGNFTRNQSSTFMVDSSVPTISVGTFILNGNSVTANTGTVTFAMSATDNLSGVSNICLKFSATVPTSSDPCWKTVGVYGGTISTSVSINNYYLLGFVPGLYNVYAWVKDSVGNQSVLSSSGNGTINTDKFSLTFTPLAPPQVSNVTAFSVDTPASPPVSGDYTVAASTSAIIKWKVTNASPLTATPITISYTTDDVNYTVISNSVANAANAGCTVDGSAATGCYSWNVGAVTGFIRIKVKAIDNVGLSSSSTSNPLNTASTISVIAGNTDLGTGSSATGAIFLYNPDNVVTPDAGSLVVQQNGTIFYRDKARGILRIKPSDGVQEVFLKLSATSTGDGGPVTGATVALVHKMALDNQDRLLIFDYNRIRRVDFSTEPATISTFIGGGAQTGDNLNPTDIQISASTSSTMYRLLPLFALPNGDIYFKSDNYAGPVTSSCFRKYTASTGKIKMICPTGSGYWANTGTAWTSDNYFQNFGVTYDVNTSEITNMLVNITYKVPGDSYDTPAALDVNTFTTNGIYPAPPINSGGHHSGYVQGADGNLYAAISFTRRLQKYDPATLSWVNIFGNGTSGECADGTAALSCSNAVKDMFVSKAGQIYFVDKNLIRTIDANGKVLTLMGRKLSYGDGGLATSAYFNSLVGIDKDNAGRYTAFDSGETTLREFTLGGNISLLAGNGTATAPQVGVDPKTTGFSTQRHLVDPVTGDVFASASGRIFKLKRSTGLFEALWGYGSTYTYYSASADGATGGNISASGYSFPILGFDGTNVVAAPVRYISPNFVDSFLKLVNKNTGTQAVFAGVTGNESPVGYCTDGSVFSTCATPRYTDAGAPELIWDSVNSRWIWTAVTPNGNAIRTVTSGILGTLATLPRNPHSIAYAVRAGVTYLYYCNTTTGRLYRYNVNTSTEALLPWPISTMSCTAGRMIYDANRDSLITIFKQNGLYGVMEYKGL